MNKNRDPDTFWFPGKWLGGITLIIAPLAMLASQLLLIKFDFFFPRQLEAFKNEPTLIISAYNLFLAGNILLWPAILTVTHLVGRTKPVLAQWGGAFVIFGLFARTFHYGVNHLAFQLVKVETLVSATKTIGASYGAFHIVSMLSATILFGWVILAIGCYFSGTLGLVRSLCLGSMSALMIGVLKGSSFVSVTVSGCLCIALVPLGVKVLRTGIMPEKKFLGLWIVLILFMLALMYFLGQAG
jgi:hypothetical protein